jgi:hypothetical protein
VVLLVRADTLLSNAYFNADFSVHLSVFFSCLFYSLITLDISVFSFTVNNIILELTILEFILWIINLRK